MNKEEQRGYDAAMGEIMGGGNPQELWNDSEGSIDQNDFDKGWQKACKEEGAVDPY